jgi:hypothetical protein
LVCGRTAGVIRFHLLFSLRMSVPNPEMLHLLAAAAAHRAAGRSWETVAARLGRSAETCRRWPQRFREAWRTLYRAAERDCTTEGRAEATAILRDQLRLIDTKEKRDAAKALLAAAQRDRRASRSKQSRQSSLEQVAMKLPDEQIRDIESSQG